MKDADNKDFLFAIARDLLPLIEKETTHQEAAVTRMDTAVYFSEARFAAERKLLFRKTPMILALSCELPAPGSFKRHELAGMPLLLTRDKTGRARAFLNACRHRGVRVTDKECGTASRFTCPYHAWTFGSDGALLALPGEDVFGEVDKASLGLVEFPTEEKYGMIFGVLTPGADLDVDSWLGEGAKFLGGWHFEDNTLVAERPLETKANWKLALDTFTENYHFHVLHTADFGYKVKNCAGHWKFGNKDQHWSLSWPSKSMTELFGKPESEWGQVNDHFSVLHYVFPNTIFAIYPETCAMMQVFPGETVGEQTTQLKFFARSRNPDAKMSEYVDERLEVFHRVLQTEDYWACGQAWDGVRSGVLPELLYGRNEPALTWMHQSLDAAMAELEAEEPRVGAFDRAG
jgi:Phenylpropionate dioxygenase and related ring-hydroxylating dioxygenases, large terminal subunit